jgi:hypothetical protein
LVCGGVLYLPKDENPEEKRFRIPYVNGKYLIPVLVIACGWFFREHIQGTLQSFTAGWETWQHHVPFYLFMIIAIIVAIMAFANSFSLVPVLGLLSCFYLMTEIPVKNWLVFTVWLIAGLSIYFGFGRKNSKLNT